MTEIEWLRRDRPAVSEKLSLLYYVRDFGWNHLLPSAVAGLQSRKNIRRMNSQIFRMIVGDLLNVLVVDQILK
jgi:hypothetical protein